MSKEVICPSTSDHFQIIGLKLFLVLPSCSLTSLSIQFCSPHSFISVSDSTPHEATHMQISKDNLLFRALNL